MSAANNEAVAQLRIAVEEMDRCANNALSEIQAVATLALAAMETPVLCHDLDMIAHAFGIIKARANEAAKAIDESAEAVECNPVDAAMARRWDAHRAIGARG